MITILEIRFKDTLPSSKYVFSKISLRYSFKLSFEVSFSIAPLKYPSSLNNTYLLDLIIARRHDKR